jgi:bifunctional oligoribonuclease and PAP phosphatase NrnA
VLSVAKKKQFSKLVRENRRFLISGHVGPDGDVIGSTLALALGLKKLGKKAIAFNPDGCPAYLKFLPKSEIITDRIPDDLTETILITVDSGDLRRLGEKIDADRFKEVWNIDHHQSNTRFGKHCFIDVKAGSTGQVVHELLNACRGFKMSREIATAIFCTLSTDTGSFKYSNATPSVFQLAGKLVECGARPDQVSQALYDTFPKRRLDLLHRVLGSLKFEHEGRLAKIFLTRRDIEAVGGDGDDSDDFVNVPRGVVGVKIVCFIKEKNPTEWKLSLRSRDGLNVLNIAQSFGGGGHILAAGCTVQGTLNEVEARFDQVLKEQGYFT